VTKAPEPNPPWTTAGLETHLSAGCGLRAGKTLIVHSSMKRIGRVAGGPEAVVQAFQHVLTPSGTLLMPVFTAPTADGLFFLLETPSRTGLLTETFRRSPGVLRSRHPTHSVAAWGGRAEPLIEGHDRTSALGVSSPFHKAALAGAEVMMIGCDLTACSLIHVVEAILRVPYLGRACYEGYNRTLTLVDADGRRIEVPPRDVPGDSKGFTVVQEELERRGFIRHVRVGSAETLLFSARTCLDAAVEILRDDLAGLLCRNPKCPVCPPSRALVAQAQP
jgi:aminoglycoside 3-N-acetyltransferase